MVVVDDIQIANLKKIGLNEYEARAYASLVGLHEATAREILEVGGIPQGRVYDVLKELAKRGFIEIQEGNPTFYRAIHPTEVIRNLSNEYSSNLQQSMDTLKDLHLVSSSRYPLWVLHNEQAIVNRIFTLLKGAEKEIIVFSSHPVFFRKYSDELIRLQKNCEVTVIVDNPDKFSFRQLKIRKANKEFFYIMGDVIHEGIKYQNIFSLLIDEKEAFDVMSIGDHLIGVVTKMPIFTYIFKRWLVNIDLLEEIEKEL